MKTIIDKLIFKLSEKEWEPIYDNVDLPINELTSKSWIDQMAIILFEIKDNFKSELIESSEWDFYEFEGFTASLPKQNSKSTDIVGQNKEFIKEITKGFIKKQAEAIYNNELEEFYNKLFDKYEFENN